MRKCIKNIYVFVFIVVLLFSGCGFLEPAQETITPPAFETKKTEETPGATGADEPEQPNADNSGHGNRGNYKTFAAGDEKRDEPDVQVPLGGDVSYDALNRTMYALTKEIGARRTGTKGCRAAQQYLETCLEALGFTKQKGTLVTQDVLAYGQHADNVIAILPASDPNAKIIVVSAHYDSVRDVEGAVDNASGVAALMETARIVTQSGMALNCEIRFCFFAAEEDGYYGAYQFIKLLSDSERARLACAFNVDMVGYANNSAPKALVISTKGIPATCDDAPAKPNVVSGAIVDSFYEIGMFAPRFYSPTNIGKHDAIPFYKTGIPVATLSWREIDYDRAVGNELGTATPKDNHTAADCFENLNMNSVYETTKLIVATTFKLDLRV